MTLHAFSNPVLACALVSKDGAERTPLWTNTQRVNGSGISLIDESLPSLAVVQELTIEIDLGKLPRLSATLVMPQADAIKFLESEAIVYTQTRLECQFGYVVGNKFYGSPPYSGLLMKPEIQVGVETTITLLAEGTQGFDATRRGSGHQLSGKRNEIIEQILKGPDSTNPRKIDVNFDEVRNSSGLANELMFNTDITIAAGWVTDWHIVMRLVKEARCWMISDGNSLKIFPIDARFTKAPIYEFYLFSPLRGLETQEGEETSLGPGSKIYPALNFSSPNASNVYLPNIIRGMVLKGVNDSTGDSFAQWVSSDGDNEGGEAESRVGNPDAGVPKGSQDHPDGDKTTGEGLDPHHADQPTDDEKSRARSEVKAANAMMGITVEIESLGVPEILPGEVFRFKGLGKAWDRNYAVHAVVHRIGTGGFTTTITGVNDTGIITEQVNTIFGTVSDKEKSAESDDSTDRQPSAG